MHGYCIKYQAQQRIYVEILAYQKFVTSKHCHRTVSNAYHLLETYHEMRSSL